MKLQPLINPSAPPEFLSGGGEMGERIRQFNWAETQLGPVHTWPQSLRTCLRIMLTSRQPIWIGWGKELIKFYNDPYQAIVGGKHPWALGQPVSAVWKDIWRDIEPMLQQVMENDQGTYVESQLLIMERNGYREETYYTFSYTPIPGDDGRTAGVFCANSDDTDKIISERQLRTLTQLGKRLSNCHNHNDVIHRTIETMQENAYDFPFALFRTLQQGKAQLVHATPLGEAEASIPKEIDLDGRYPIARAIKAALQSGEMQVVEGMKAKSGTLPTGAWNEPPTKGIVLPILQKGVKEPFGFLIVGANPYRLIDEKYQGFFSLVADLVATAFADVHVLEEERKRAEALAEIDRAKTTFFSNISHEFRTPLTLLLGPVEDALNDPNTVEENRIRLDVAYRNALRMQKLVNTLLDFSRIEAGRMEGTFAKVDLAAITQELSGSFRSAIEKAGMQLNVSATPLKNDVYVDEDLWEKIVLNLLSNAFKYSREGAISVHISEEENEAVLRVTDTGIGIPPNQLEKIFDRFHRVEGVHGRSQEGTGIGLAMVKELVRIHGGTIGVSSEVGKGSTFTVRIPTGRAHLPLEKISNASTETTGSSAKSFVQESLRWLPEPAPASPPEAPNNERPLVLLADDNADMRDYVSRLLSKQFRVLTATNGEEAFEKALTHRPTVLISDVMMPRLDGFELLQKMRQHTDTKGIPVIFLSARAGEEAEAEGLEAGADDYLVKPFSARELLARVQNQWRIRQVRQETEKQFYHLFSQAPALIHVLKGPDHVFELFHPLGKALLGGRDLTGVSLKQALPELESQGFIDILDRVYHHGETIALHETPVRLPLQNEELTERYFNLTYQPLTNVKGTIEGVLNFGVDVTDTVTARKKIEESEAHFRNLTNTAPAIIWTTRADGYCTFLSRSWYETTGQTPEEAEGFGWLHATHPDDAAKAGEVFTNANEKQIPFHIQYRLRQADGSYRWSIDQGSPRFSSTGEFEGFVGIVLDVHEQRLAQQALEESEQRQKLSVEAAGMGTWRCDLDTGLVYCSERTMEIFGFAENPVPLNTVFETVVDEHRALVQEAVAEATQREDGRYNAEYDLQNMADGSIRSVVANGRVFFDEARRPVKFIGTCLDVTEQKQIENTIRQSEKRYKHIFEGTPVSIWEEDFTYVRDTVFQLKAAGVTDFAHYMAHHPDVLQTLVQSIAVKDVNEATLTMLKAASKDELKQGLHRVFVSDTTEAFVRELEIIANGGGHFEYETTLQDLRGALVEVLVHIDFPTDADYSSVLVSLVNISERRKAERALEEKRRDLELAIEIGELGAFKIDPATQTTTFSERIRTWWDLSSHQAPVEDIFSAVVDEDKERVKTIFTHAFPNSQQHDITYAVPNRQTGGLRYLRSIGQTLFADGKPVATSGIIQDVTEQRNATDKLESLVLERTAELQRSNNDLQQFAHVASHDLKEPLRKIKTFANRLSEDKGNDFTPKSAEFLTKIHSAANRMFDMVDGVLNYSLVNATEQATEAVDLAEVFRSIHADLEIPIAQKEAQLFVDPLPAVQGSSLLLYQLFYNLVNNSLKFARSGVPPVIQVTAGTALVGSEPAVEIRVSDNGIGFEPAYADRIFESFIRLNSKDQFEGTGLGLSLCKRIAERHHGTIEAIGKPGEGATFVVRLPNQSPEKQV